MDNARFNERKIAMSNAEKEDPVYRSRTSRLEKWKEISKQARIELDVPAEAPEALKFLGFWFQLLDMHGDKRHPRKSNENQRKQ